MAMNSFKKMLMMANQIDDKPSLPDGYLECEWITLNNRATIDTGIAGDNDQLAIEINCRWDSYIQYGELFRNYIGEDSNGWRIILGTNNNSIYYNANWKSNSGLTAYTDNYSFHTYYLSRVKFGFDGVYQTVEPKEKGLANNANILIGSPIHALKNNIRHFKIWKISRLIFNGIPALRISDGKAGLYDSVSDKFYTSTINVGYELKYVIPLSYRVLEYLKTDSTQFIDTGIQGDDDTLSFEISCRWENFIQYGRIFHNYAGTDKSNRYRIILDSTSTILYDANGSNNFTSSAKANNYYTFKLSRQRFCTNGTCTAISNLKEGDSNNLTIYIGGGGVGNPPKRDIGLQFNYFKVWSGDTLIQHLIPALRIADSKPGMYDLVSGQFFTNQGTGEFTYQ